MSGERFETEQAAQRAPALSWPAKIAFAFGAIGLIGAMATDSVAVVGRLLGVPLLGSVEAVQAFVVISASAAFVAATLSREHVAVRALTDRLPGAAQSVLGRLGDLAAGLFFVALLAGSVWIAFELRDGAERTELLGIPLFWLRAFWIVCAAACAGLFLWRALARRRAP